MGDEVNPYLVDLVSDGLRGVAADEHIEILLGEGIEHERNFSRVAGAKAVVVFGGGVVEPVDPGARGSGGGPGFGDPDRRDGEKPVGDDGGEDVTGATFDIDGGQQLIEG